MAPSCATKVLFLVPAIKDDYDERTVNGNRPLGFRISASSQPGRQAEAESQQLLPTGSTTIEKHGQRIFQTKSIKNGERKL